MSASSLSTPPQPTDDFGDAPPDPSHIAAVKLEREHDWRLYFRRTQFHILVVLVVLVILLICAEIAAKALFDMDASYLSDVLSVITPVFTFLIGMGVSSRED